jgi:hypothetical protein
VSIIRVGLAETKNFSENYKAIFGAKKEGTAKKKAKPAAKKKAKPAAKKPKTAAKTTTAKKKAKPAKKK